jgi:excisionase family DNA binding protein
MVASIRRSRAVHQKPEKSYPPLAYRIPDAVRVSGLGRTKLYQLINTGKLRAIHVGGRRLILAESLRELLDGDDA